MSRPPGQSAAPHPVAPSMAAAPATSATGAASISTTLAAGGASPASFLDDERLNPHVNVACLDFLLIELVPVVQRVTERLAESEGQRLEAWRARTRMLEGTGAEGGERGEEEKKKSDAPEPSGPGKESVHTAATGPLEGRGILPGSMPDEKCRPAVFWRLEGLGYRVGQGLVERFSADKPRPTSPLDAIKFVCKELWPRVFRKPVDNLKTNHRGVFVLGDARFAGLARVSVDRRAGAGGSATTTTKAGAAATAAAAEDTLKRAQVFLYFPCGVIRGALAGLGIEASVTAETTEIPVATFQIKLKGAKT